MQLDVERWKALTSLWKDVHALHAKDLDAGWRMVCERLGSLFGSAGGFALFFVRTPGGAFHGWQPMRQLDHGDGSDARMKMSAEWAMTAECRSDPYAAKMFEESGFARAYRPSDLAPSETERLASPSYRLMEKYGVEDRMVAVCSVSEDVEVVFGFDRPAGADDFTEADRDTAEVAMEMLGKTCRWLALSYGYYPRGNPLTDRERSVLAHLLNGFSEKEAASRVGISPGSLHQVVVRAYRKFGVQSRAELMALWLATDD